VVEPNRQQPLSGHVLDTAMATAGAKVSVQVGDRLADTGVVSIQDCPAGCRIPQAVEDRHALGRPQHDVERWHGVAAVGAAEELAGVGVTALEHPPEPRRGCFALQPQAAGAGAVPAARGLTVARQVLLVVGGQLAGVVLLPPHRELGDVGHHPARSLLAFVGASERTPGALLSSDDFGSSVERDGGVHPLWQGFLWQGSSERRRWPVESLWRLGLAGAAGQATGCWSGRAADPSVAAAVAVDPAVQFVTQDRTFTLPARPAPLRCEEVMDL
jgi:hypothetical protein